MVSIQRRCGCSRPLMLLYLASMISVNSRMTSAWLTPTTTSITAALPSVHKNNHRRHARLPSATCNTASGNAHRLKHMAPRRALEVMSDGDQHHSSSATSPQPQQQQPSRTESSFTPALVSEASESDPTTLKVVSQQQQLSLLENHPVLQRLVGEDDDLSLQQKVINLVFLSAAFGYAIYTIFNIDSGMTRGWTVQEQVMRIPLDNWGAYESYLANKPIITKTLINVIIYLLGDWLSQTAFQGKHVLNFDISRTLRNGFIGLCFGPLVHQYYEFSDAILPPENGLVTRLEKIFMDQTIYLTVKCSIYISAVGLLAGEEWSTVKQTVKDKIVGVVFTAWKFWPIVHCITYRYVIWKRRSVDIGMRSD
jgi:protein Mpv17